MGAPKYSPADNVSLQLQVLGRAASLLAAASDFDDTLRRTIGACLPALGDFGFFDVVTSGGVRRTAAAHDDPALEALLAPTQWQRQERTDLNLCALSTGEAALHSDVTDSWYRKVAANEAHLGLLRRLAFRSMLTVPVRYQGELVGALTLFMGASGRHHTPGDLAFAAELATLAAPVVVNARLLEQHRAAESALRQSEQRLRTAVEAGQVGIWEWDIGKDEVQWSDRVYELHGLPVGSDTGGLEGFRARVHPDDRARVEQALAAALAGSEPYSVEFRSRLPDGGVRWIATRSQVVRDTAGQPLRMIGASTDITHRMESLAAERQARDQAEAARRRMELLANAGSLLAHSLETEDTLRAIATTIVPDVADWCRIDLLDEHGVLQRRLAHHSDPARAQRALEMARRFRARPGTVGSMAWCIEHGRSHHGRFDEPPASDDPDLRAYTQAFEMREHMILPLVARGRTIGAMGVVQAESGRSLSPEDRALIRELGLRAALALDNARLFAEAEAARRQAENASRVKDEFLAMLGHELRNPLAPIAAALELMGRRDPAAHVEERRVVGRQVAHLSRLIDDLLDVSRITQGKVELQRERLNLRTVVANALEQTQPMFAHRRAPVLELADGPCQVVGDAVRLTQVVCNLLNNAAKFTPPEGRVTLTLRTEGGWVEIAVRDEGRGIAPELLPRVFDMFVQGRQALDRQWGGLGLGLAIVRMLVALHGGFVRAESEGEGRGARFVVRIPAAEPASTSAPAEPPAAAEDKIMATARILVVDDNADAGETLTELLRLVGYEARCAQDGEAALRSLEEAPADLALLDIGLPGMDGYELATRVRARPEGKTMKLVALTGYGRDKDRERAMAASFDEHLVKPVSMDQLLTMVERLLLPG